MGDFVSVLVDRRVRPGHEGRFEELLSEIIQVSKTYRGYVGTDVLRPRPGSGGLYHVIFRFDDQENLNRWLESPERLEILDQIDRELEEPSRFQVISGLETWFCLPGRKTLEPPPRYKMAVVTWVAITPLLIGFNSLFAPWLEQLSLPMRFVCSTPILVVIMTYGLMPAMTKLFRGWLYPHPARPEEE